jgi:hypothetical protein
MLNLVNVRQPSGHKAEMVDGSTVTVKIWQGGRLNSKTRGLGSNAQAN